MLLHAVLLTLALRSQVDPLAGKVTFQTAAAPANVAMRKLAQVAGVPMKAVGEIADEMLILRFQDVPLSTAMAKIAECATATWTKTDEGYELRRPQSLVRAIEKKERDERLSKLKKLIEPQVAAFGPFTESTARVMLEHMTRPTDAGDDQRAYEAALDQACRADRQQPVRRLALRLLTAVGLDTIADLPPGRTVFSTAPSKMQKQLPSESMALVAEYVRDQNLWHRVAAPPEDEPPNIQIGGMDMWPGPYVQEVQGTPAHCLFDVQTGADRDNVDGIRMTVYLADGQGELISIASAGDLRGSYPLWQRIDRPPGFPDDQDEQIEDIKLSLPAQQLSDMQSADSIPLKAQLARATEASPYVLHPEDKELLTLFPSDPLLKAAAKQNVNIAACVDDTTFSRGAWPNSNQVLKYQLAALDMQRVEGWLLAKPKHPLTSEHVDRAALGRFFQAYLREGRVSLETAAQWARYEPESVNSTLHETLSAMMEEGSSISPSFDAAYVKLYGSLNASQHNHLLHGGTLTVADMSNEETKYVRDIVYSLGPDNLERVIDDGANAVAPSIFADEPTYFLQGGLDPATTLRIEPTYNPVLFVTKKSGDSDPQEQQEDLDQVADEIWDAQKPKEKRDPDDAEPAAVLGYRLGVHREYQITLSLPGRHSTSGSLSESEEFPGPLLSLSQLPSAIQKELAAKVESLKHPPADDDEPPPGNK